MADAAAIAAATGAAVTSMWIHLPVRGVVVEVVPAPAIP